MITHIAGTIYLDGQPLPRTRDHDEARILCAVLTDEFHGLLKSDRPLPGSSDVLPIATRIDDLQTAMDERDMWMRAGRMAL